MIAGDDDDPDPDDVARELTGLSALAGLAQSGEEAAAAAAALVSSDTGRLVAQALDTFFDSHPLARDGSDDSGGGVSAAGLLQWMGTGTGGLTAATINRVFEAMNETNTILLDSRGHAHPV